VGPGAGLFDRPDRQRLDPAGDGQRQQRPGPRDRDQAYLAGPGRRQRPGGRRRLRRVRRVDGHGRRAAQDAGHRHGHDGELPAQGAQPDLGSRDVHRARLGRRAGLGGPLLRRRPRGHGHYRGCDSRHVDHGRDRPRLRAGVPSRGDGGTVPDRGDHRRTAGPGQTGQRPGPSGRGPYRDGRGHGELPALQRGLRGRRRGRVVQCDRFDHPARRADLPGRVRQSVGDTDPGRAGRPFPRDPQLRPVPDQDLGRRQRHHRRDHSGRGHGDALELPALERGRATVVPALRADQLLSRPHGRGREQHPGLHLLVPAHGRGLPPDVHRAAHRRHARDHLRGAEPLGHHRRELGPGQRRGPPGLAGTAPGPGADGPDRGRPSRLGRDRERLVDGPEPPRYARPRALVGPHLSLDRRPARRLGHAPADPLGSHRLASGGRDGLHPDRPGRHPRRPVR